MELSGYQYYKLAKLQTRNNLPVLHALLHVCLVLRIKIAASFGC